ncbi:MAG TPA: DinB family protein [Candidatus Limnocylindrales bacterium]
MARTIDPVAEASAYQRMLLDALGDDDPADVQSSRPASVRALVAEAAGLLRARPAAGEWSVVECVGHLCDAEIVASSRDRWIVAHDEPAIAGYDQERWASRLRWIEPDVDLEAELPRPFEVMRRANVALWRRLPIEDRPRLGMHTERGPESYERTFRLLAGHDRIHLAQARQALDAVRGR